MNNNSIPLVNKLMYCIHFYTNHNSLYNHAFHGTMQISLHNTVWLLDGQMFLTQLNGSQQAFMMLLASPSSWGNTLHNSRSWLWLGIWKAYVEFPCSLIRKLSQARRMNLVIFWKARQLTDVKSGANVLDRQNTRKQLNLDPFRVD